MPALSPVAIAIPNRGSPACASRNAPTSATASGCCADVNIPSVAIKTNIAITATAAQIGRPGYLTERLSTAKTYSNVATTTHTPETTGPVPCNRKPAQLTKN